MRHPTAISAIAEALNLIFPLHPQPWGVRAHSRFTFSTRRRQKLEEIIIGPSSPDHAACPVLFVPLQEKEKLSSCNTY